MENFPTVTPHVYPFLAFPEYSSHFAMGNLTLGHSTGNVQRARTVLCLNLNTGGLKHGGKPHPPQA